MMFRGTCKTLLAVVLGVALLLTGGCPEMWNFGKREPRLTSAQVAEKHVESGKSFIRQGDIAQALKELAAAIKEDPKSAEAYTTLGDIYRHKRDYKNAVIAYTEACKNDSYAFRPHYNLGVTYQTLAATAIDYATSREYLKHAINTYLRSTVINPESFDAHLNLGTCYFQIGQFDMADQETQRALQIKPDSIKAVNNLGIIAETQGDLEKAIDYYKTSIEGDPKQMNILLNLASLYTRTGKFNAAKSTYLAAKKLDEENPALWQQIGVFFFRTEHFERAVQAFQYSIHLDPNSPGAYRGLGVVCMTIFIKNNKRTDLLDKALLAWRLSLKLQPNQPELQALYDKYHKLKQ